MIFPVAEIGNEIFSDFPSRICPSIRIGQHTVRETVTELYSRNQLITSPNCRIADHPEVTRGGVATALRSLSARLCVYRAVPSLIDDSHNLTFEKLISSRCPEHREDCHYPAAMDLQMRSIGGSATVAIDSGQGSAPRA